MSVGSILDKSFPPARIGRAGRAVSAAAAVALCGLLAACSAISIDPVAPDAGAGAVPVNVSLDWADVAGAKAYDVYFGPRDPPAFQGRVATSAFRLETLAPARTYYWRANPIVGETPSSTPVRRFTTAAAASKADTHAWPIRIAQSVRGRFPRPSDLGQWNYTEGMVVDGLYSVAVETGRADDIAYAQQWVDRFVTPAGVIRNFPTSLHSLDRIRPGPLLLWLHARTGDDRYAKAADFLASMLDAQPTTREGGFWHRSVYPNQMWLDGLYMADVFAVQYAARRNAPKYFDVAVRQATLMRRHTLDPKTGLLYHGWDEGKSRPWADRVTGASPEFWGRAVGWYGMALVDMLDWLPEDHPGRAELISILKELARAVVPFQDRNTGMWFQILDKGDRSDNYVETSCTLMLAYMLTRGAQRGFLPPESLEHARRATRGVLNHEVDLVDDRMDIRGTVEVGSLGGNGGTYDYYVKVPLRTNDLKSIGAFLYLSLALSETAGQ